MSENILLRFAKEAKRRMIRLHGAALIKGGEVIEEIYFGNYSADTHTRMYSTSKSVAAVAIEKLAREGRLSLDDRVVNIFADRFDMSDVHPYIAEQTVRQMLTMSTAYSKPTYSADTRDWLASYFKAEPTHPAGTVWHYDSSGSYVLGAITKHLTGLDYIEYLRPEFDVMDISRGVHSLKGPDEEAWASSGFMATTTDLGKIAYLLLSGGRWGGKQLIPEDFARDAISPLVRNDDGTLSSMYECGYGYQIWAHPNGSFAFRGLGGQVAIGFPGRDLVFVCNSDTAGTHNAYDQIFEAVDRIIVPEFPITDRAAYDNAQRKPVIPEAQEAIADSIYVLDENKMGITRLRFVTHGESVSLYYTREGIEREIVFGIGHEESFVFPESYSGDILFDKDRYVNYSCTAIGEWIEPRKLRVRIWAEDIYVGNMSMSFGFREDGKIGVKMMKNAQFFFDGFDGYTGGVRS